MRGGRIFGGGKEGRGTERGAPNAKRGRDFKPQNYNGGNEK